jgi:hypothetical protein
MLGWGSQRNRLPPQRLHIADSAMLQTRRGTL